MRDILSNFLEVEKIGDGKWKARSRQRKDKNKSVFITRTGDRWLVWDFGNDDIQGVLSSNGLRLADLYDSPKTPLWIIKMQEWFPGYHIAGRFDYSDSTGEYTFSHIRLENGSGKTFYPGRIRESDGWITKVNGDSKRGFFGSLKEIIENPKAEIWIAEGEKCVVALNSLGLSALTSGNWSSWKKDYHSRADWLRGRKITICCDADFQGARFAEKVSDSLKGIAAEVKIILPDSNAEGNDVYDFFERGGTAEQLKALPGITPAEIKKMFPNKNIKIEKPPAGFQTENQTGGAAETGTGIQQETNGCSIIDYTTKQDTEQVFELLKYNKDGKIVQSVANWQTVFQNDPRFTKRISFDEFSGRTYIRGKLPWSRPGESNFRQMSDVDQKRFYAMIEDEYGLKRRADFEDALAIAADDNRMNFCRDLIQGLPYKGDGYIRQIFPKFLGAEDSQYVFEATKRWMIGCVSRAYSAGAKHDNCLILSGAQGLGKSTLCRLLALDDTLHADSLPPLKDTKAVAEVLQGKWIVEIAELAAFEGKNALAALNRTITAVADACRVAYGHRSENYRRTANFIGSTNNRFFLPDETGSRRFLPVWCGEQKPTGSVFSPECYEIIRCAWAEARELYLAGETSVLPAEVLETARMEQQSAYIDTGETGVIAKYLETKEIACVRSIWFEALGAKDDPKAADSKRIGNIMSLMPGWKYNGRNNLRFEHYGSQKGWIRVETKSETNGISETKFETGDAEIPFE